MAIGTNLVDQVCRGTLESLDAAVNSIEAELNLPLSGEKIPLYVVDDETFAAHCDFDGPVLGCVKHSSVVFVSSGGFRHSRHELVHARLGQMEIRSTPLFDEGIAAALDRDGGCLLSDWCLAANLDALLAAPGARELHMLGGYVAGADLVHGMLASYGPDAVLEFMDEVGAGSSPSELRSLYIAHFGGVLDEDFEAFKRGAHDDYTIAQLGCDALPGAPSAGPFGGARLDATMDCDSALVINVFHKPGVGQMRWTMPITTEQSGTYMAAGAAQLRGCFPPRFSHQDLLDFGPWDYAWYPSFAPLVKLHSRLYELTWTAEFGSDLKFEIAPPCSFEAANCAAGEQCTIWNECRAEAASLATLGDPCEQERGGPLVCEAGSRCAGGECVAECDATQACPAGEACARFRVCGALCGLLAQDCEPGFACVPSSDLELNATGVGVCVVEGPGDLLEPCDRSEGSCRAGLSCEVASACTDPVFCCVPLCDAGAASSGCGPVGACDPIVDGSVGVCTL